MTSEISNAPVAGPETPSGRFTLEEGSVLARNKLTLLAALKDRGVRLATVCYEGSGDSGGIESLLFETVNGEVFEETAPVRTVTQRSHFLDGRWQHTDVDEDQPIEQALRTFVDAVLGLVHGGWENGEGASGSVVFDCEAGLVRIEHSVYFTDSELTETEL